MKEKMEQLMKPLSVNDIELRVGNSNKDTGWTTYLLYKTARTDTERLNSVFGANWKREHYIDTKGNYVCKVSIYNEEIKEWVSREDVGEQSNVEKEKGGYSDSFKRACTSWGIGIELYKAPRLGVKISTDKNAPKTNVKLDSIETENQIIKKVVLLVDGKKREIGNCDFIFDCTEIDKSPIASEEGSVAKNTGNSQSTDVKKFAIEIKTNNEPFIKSLTDKGFKHTKAYKTEDMIYKKWVSLEEKQHFESKLKDNGYFLNNEKGYFEDKFSK